MAAQCVKKEKATNRGEGCVQQQLYTPRTLKLNIARLERENAELRDTLERNL